MNQSYRLVVVRPSYRRAKVTAIFGRAGTACLPSASMKELRNPPQSL